MDALVEMLVAREDDVDVTVDEDRLEHQAKGAGAGAVAAGRVERMVEVADLPRGAGFPSCCAQPVELLGIERAAVEHEEPDARAGQPDGRRSFSRKV